MKASILSLVLVTGLVAAQSDKIPSCATSCISKYTTGDGIAGCGQLDIKCICSNKDFLSGIACCLKDKCDASGQEAAVKYAKQICSSAGVTVPDQVTCNQDTSSESASASASGSQSAATKSASKSESASATESSSKDTATAKAATSAATTTAASSADEATSTGSSSAPSSTSSGAAVAGMDSATGLMGAVMAVLLAL
ncbi:hypothetical protein BGZ63DRAFT_375080 [Mariannaea sp. PMI_226]|nr:hypothetical protein BGZ63DRAFT_375080 [Mariannaea sp. PMI_226]